METVFTNKDEKIDFLTKNGYEINIGGLLSEAWEIYKKNIGGFLGYTLLYLAINGAVSMIPVAGNLAGVIVGPSLFMGFGLVARKIKMGQPVAFNDFFGGFEKFGPLFLGGLISSLFMVLGFICLILPGFYLAVCYMPLVYFIWYNHNGSYLQTLEKCRKMVSKRWWQMFGFLLVLGLVNLAGAICLLVGLLVTIPVSLIAIYLFYEHTVGTIDDDRFDFEGSQSQATPTA